MVKNALQQGLEQRHIAMIALGGVIGAGLFVGSGSLIATAGPAAILSYLVGGVIVTLVMFMLGEMASQNPDAGSFSTYASMYLGEWAGFAVGWLYWFKSMMTITIEAILLGAILHDVFVWLPVWGGALLMLFALVGSNACSVRSFGEAEYWLSFAKVAAIIVFMLFGVSILLNMQAQISSPGLVNLIGRGGFMPAGWSSVIAGVMVVIFSLGGSEIAAVAAGESEDPKRNVARAIRSVVLRVLIFYVGSVSIVILCIPWTDKANLASPYVSLLNLAGFPWAAGAMKIILFVSFMSVMNSFLYSNSRMLFSLSQRGYAPGVFGRTNSRGVPRNALLLSFSLCVAILVIHYVSGGDLFLTLAKSSGAFVMTIWAFIVAAHFRMRRKMSEAQKRSLSFKAWFYPYSNVVAFLTLVAVLAAQAFNPGSRFQFWFTVCTVMALVVGYSALRRQVSFGVMRSGHGREQC